MNYSVSNSDHLNFDTLVAYNLKFYRLDRGFTQSELASAIGLSRNSISSVENGKYCLSFYHAYKVAKFFDIPVEMLLYVPKENGIYEKTV